VSHKRFVDRGNREFFDVFLILGSFFLSVFICMILNEKIIALGGFSFTLKAFVLVCVVGIIFRKVVERPGVPDVDSEDVVNGTVRHQKDHYRHIAFYYVMELINLVIAPALVGFFIAGMFIHIGS
jgi:hypothetical protein